MTKNTQINFNDLQKISEHCDATLDDLEKFHDQLIKVIEVKKKSSVNHSANIELNQAQDALGYISNLEKINENLVKAIDEVKQLIDQKRVLLSKPVNKT